MPPDHPASADRGAEIVDALWRIADPEGAVPRGAVDSFAQKAGRHNAEVPAELESMISIFDEYVLWMIHLSTALTYEDCDLSQERIALGSVAGGITSLLLSVRSLVVSGFDVSAKILMRSVTEYADILFLLIVDPERVADYTGVESFKEANAFWHTWIKGWKARRRALEGLAQGNTSSAWWRELEAYQKQEEEVMSLSSHGAYIAAYRASFPVLSLGETTTPAGWAGYLGTVTPASVRTLEYVAYALLPIYASQGFPFHQREEKGSVLVASESRLADPIERRRRVLFGLIQHLSIAEDPA
jgi:hypothetical protein